MLHRHDSPSYRRVFGGGVTGSDVPVTSAAPASCACTAPVSPHTHSSRADRHMGPEAEIEQINKRVSLYLETVCHPRQGFARVCRCLIVRHRSRPRGKNDTLERKGRGSYAVCAPSVHSRRMSRYPSAYTRADARGMALGSRTPHF